MRAGKAYRYFSYIIVALVLTYFGSTYIKTRREINRLQGVKEELSIETKRLNEKLETLNYDLENSDTLQFIEKNARALGMIKPGETIIIDMDKEKEEKEK